MNGSNVAKLLGLMIGIIVINIVVLSPGLLGLEIGGGSTLETAAGVTLLIVSGIVLLYRSYVLLFGPQPTETPKRQNVQNHEDFVEALTRFPASHALQKEIAFALDQLERILKKRDTLIDVLRQRFQPDELSYKKFISVIDEVGTLFYLNHRGILNKLYVFEPAEYERFRDSTRAASLSSRLVQEKAALYGEFMSYITGYLNANEEILLKLDKLVLEITLLGSADYRDIEEMTCMKEIDELIKQTKYYNP